MTEISTNLADLSRQSMALRADIASYEAAHVRERRAYRLLSAFLLVTTVTGLLLSLVVFTTLHAVRDCTSPEGKCAQRGQQQTGKAVMAIADINTRRNGMLIECTRVTKTVPEFRTCVKNRTGIDLSQPVPQSAHP